MKTIRLILALLAVLIFASYLAHAQQFHIANEIMPGTFTAGEYIFQGTLNFTNQPSNQITIIPSDLLNPQFSVIRIRNASNPTTNLIELRKGGDIVSKGVIYAKRMGIGLDPFQEPKYALDIPNGDLEVKNISITASDTPYLGFQGDKAYINTRPIGNIYIGSGIWGNISNVNIGGNLSVGGTISMGYEIVSSECTNCLGTTVVCPAGKKVLGGGCEHTASDARHMYMNSPGGYDDRWWCWWIENSGSYIYKAYAICANIR